MLKPYTPPTRRRLASTLLDDAHERVEHQMEKVLTESAGQVTIIIDSWTNIRRESLTNYIAATRNHTIFIKSEVTGSERHTGDAIARGICDTIEQVGGDAVVVAVATDNASNMRSFHNMIINRYPSILTVGCASHVVNLTVNEILKLDTLSATLRQANELIQYFKASSILLGLLNDVAAASHTTRKALQVPNNTCW